MITASSRQFYECYTIRKKHTNRVTKYKWVSALNFDGIDFPVSLKEIDKFELQNPNLNMSGVCVTLPDRTS